MVLHTFNFEIAKREAKLLYAIFHQRSHISLTPEDGSHQSHFGQNFFFNCFGNLGLQWDEPVSPNIVKNWDSFSLNYLNWEKINIPRWEWFIVQCTQKMGNLPPPRVGLIPARLF